MAPVCSNRPAETSPGAGPTSTPATGQTWGSNLGQTEGRSEVFPRFRMDTHSETCCQRPPGREGRPTAGKPEAGGQPCTDH